MSIDHDMCLSFVRLMVGHGRSFTAVDWCIAIMCHNVMYCMAVDESGIWSVLFWCG